MSKVEQYITSIPDYPKAGIIFRDITSVLKDADGLRLAVDEMTAKIGDTEFDAIKLPRATSRIAYDLEYGSAEIEVHREDITPGMRVVIVDDLIATGGTLEAAVHLVEQLGAKVVKIVCLLELKGLHGRDRLTSCPTEAVVSYEGK